jgi:hypothetical protein
MTGPGAGVPAAGSEIMNVLIGLAVKGSHAHAPMTTSSQQPSTLGPAIGAGAAGLAVGAGAAAALMRGKGKPAHGEVPGSPPAPPSEMPGAKPAVGATPAAASPKTPTPPPGGTATVPEAPTKAPTDPKKYSGFEEAELGKGTKIVLGSGGNSPKPIKKEPKVTIGPIEEIKPPPSPPSPPAPATSPVSPPSKPLSFKVGPDGTLQLL